MQSEPALRRLPAVSRLLDLSGVRRLRRRFGDRLVTGLIRERLEVLRAGLRSGKLAPADADAAVRPAGLVRWLKARGEGLLGPRPRGVINATGIIVHTNLGRSVLGEAAARHVAAVASTYVDLEYDVAAGRRGSRNAHLEPLAELLFPGQGFLAVNNNAAATMLALRALAKGKEIIVSRGELVEIGGSFRIPDIMAASGARLREVGTTNRTRRRDYEAAVTKKTGAILKVHTSNFKIVGFTEGTPIQKLARLARKVGVPLVVDWGSGDLVDLGPLGIHDEIPVSRILEAGADLVTFSGDKLLGGPQAGCIVGRPELVDRLREDPLARVCRLDRLLVAALHQTLASYVRGRPFEEIPTLRMLAASEQAVGRRARKLGREVARESERVDCVSTVAGVSRTGGGTSPMGERPSQLLEVRWPGGDATVLEERLRAGDPPVIGRVHQGALLLDLRTVLPEQEEVLKARLVEVLAQAPARAANPAKPRKLRR